MQSCSAPALAEREFRTMRIKFFEDEPLVAHPNVLFSLVFNAGDLTMRIRDRGATGAVLFESPALPRSVKE